VREGCFYYFGFTQYGKTTLALKHLSEEVLETGRRSLILDCMPALNFKSWRHEPDRYAVLSRLCRDGTHAVYTPKDREDLEALFKALHEEVAPLYVLWDECTIHMDPDPASWCSRALRGWGHSGHVFFVTTQRPGDMPSESGFWVTAPEIYIFHLERASDLQRVEMDFGFPREAVKALPKYEPLVYWRDRSHA